MRFVTWNVRSLYRAGSFTAAAAAAAARELVRYKFVLVGVQEVKWDRGGTVRTRDYNFFPWRRKRKSSIGAGFFVHHRIVSTVKRVEFVGNRMSYTVLRGGWCSECACTK